MAEKKKDQEEPVSVDAQLKEIKEGVDALWAVVRGLKGVLTKMWNVKVDDKTAGLVLAFVLCAASAFGVPPLADTNNVFTLEDPTSTTNKLLTLDRSGNLAVDGTLTYESTAASTVSNITVDGTAWLNATSGQIGGGGLSEGKIIIGSAVTNWEPMTPSGAFTLATNGVATLAGNIAIARVTNALCTATAGAIALQSNTTINAPGSVRVLTTATLGAVALSSNVTVGAAASLPALTTATAGPVAASTNVTMANAANLPVLTTATAGSVALSTNVTISGPGSLRVLTTDTLGAVALSTNVTVSSAASLPVLTTATLGPVALATNVTFPITAGPWTLGTNVGIASAVSLATTAGEVTAGTNFILSGVQMKTSGGPINMQTNVNWTATIGPVTLPTNVLLNPVSVIDGTAGGSNSWTITLIGSTVRIDSVHGVVTNIVLNP